MRKRLPIFYNALLLTGVNLFLRFISTGFQVYLSGKIGAEGIGLLQLILSVGGLTLTAGIAGIRTATMYLTAEELGKGRSENVCWVLSGCMKYSLFCSILVSFVLYLYSPFIAKKWIGEVNAVSSIRLFSFFLPVNCLCGVMVGYFTAANRIGTLAVVEIAEQMICMVITVILLSWWAHSDSVRACESVVMGAGVGGCFTLASLAILRKRENSKVSNKIFVCKRILKAAVPLALADDLKSGISTVENMMVPKRLALCEKLRNPLAAFGMICGMVFPVLMFPAAILYGLAELLIPELARCSAAGSQKRVCYLARRSLMFSLLYGCLFCGVLFLSSHKVCWLLYGNEEAGRFLRLFSLLAPILYCDTITDAMIKGLGQQTACVRYNIFTTGLDVFLLFVLLPKYGLEGYYFSFLITHLINFLLSFRRLVRITGKLISIKIFIIVFAVSGVSIVLSSTFSSVILSCCAYILLLGSLLFLFRVIGKDDLFWVKNLFLKIK